MNTEPCECNMFILPLISWMYLLILITYAKKKWLKRKNQHYFYHCGTDRLIDFSPQLDLDALEDSGTPAGNLKIVHFGVV